MDDEHDYDVPFGGEGILTPEISMKFLEEGLPQTWDSYDEGPTTETIGAGNSLVPLNFNKH